MEAYQGQWQAVPTLHGGQGEQKNVSKVGTGETATEPNGRLLHDLALLKVPQDLKVVIRCPNWELWVDEATGMGFSRFHKNKDDILDTAVPVLKKLEQTAGREIKILRQDNAGENKALQALLTSMDVGMGRIDFEYTARKTPQQNSLVETKFPSLAGRARAMCNHANMPRAVRYVVFPEVLVTATLYDWLVVVKVGGEMKTRVQHYKGELPNWVPHMRTVGEAGTVTIGKDGKVGDRGVTMMLLGPASNHGGDTYRMYNEKTGKVIESRDVRFLGRMYYTKEGNDCKLEEPMVVVETYEDEEENGDTHVSFDMDTEVWESDDVTEVNSVPETSDHGLRRSTRVRTETPRYNPETGLDYEMEETFYDCQDWTGTARVSTITKKISAVQNYANAIKSAEEEKCWTRTDRGVKTFLTTKSGGPEWLHVTRHITQPRTYQYDTRL